MPVKSITKVKAELLDPFGAVVAKGELMVTDVPGIDEHTPSVAQEVDARLVDKRSVLSVPGYDGPAYSLRITGA